MSTIATGLNWTLSLPGAIFGILGIIGLLGSTLLYAIGSGNRERLKKLREDVIDRDQRIKFADEEIERCRKNHEEEIQVARKNYDEEKARREALEKTVTARENIIEMLATLRAQGELLREHTVVLKTIQEELRRNG